MTVYCCCFHGGVNSTPQRRKCYQSLSPWSNRRLIPYFFPWVKSEYTPPNSVRAVGIYYVYWRRLCKNVECDTFDGTRRTRASITLQSKSTCIFEDMERSIIRSSSTYTSLTTSSFRKQTAVCNKMFTVWVPWPLIIWPPIGGGERWNWNHLEWVSFQVAVWRGWCV